MPDRLKDIYNTLDENNALLTTLSQASAPDKETPNVLYRVKTGQSFTGASAGDPVISILTINTVTNTFVSNTPLWYNGKTRLPLVDADVDVGKLELIASNSLTAGELGALTLSVAATTRVCVSHLTIIVPATTGVTLASLCPGGAIPTGAVTARIQAQNNPIKVGFQSGVTVTPTTGERGNVDEILPEIDSALASVTLVAEFAAATCSVAFFNAV